MDLGAILVLLAVLIAVGLFLAAPLMRGARPQPLDEAPEVSALLAERDRVINALQELDFDFKLGKVPPDGYPAQRSELLHRGASILRELDQLKPESAGRMDAGERIEQALSASQGADAKDHGELPDERIESMLAARRAGRRDKSAGFCPHCGKPVLINDRFCPNCGKSLK